jgi:hypothetical protein
LNIYCKHLNKELEMTDTTLFRAMGVLQLLIAFINFYVANQAAAGLGVLNIAVAAMLTMTGVFCTIVGCKMFGWLDK